MKAKRPKDRYCIYRAFAGDEKCGKPIRNERIGAICCDLHRWYENYLDSKKFTPGEGT